VGKTGEIGGGHDEEGKEVAELKGRKEGRGK